MLTGEPPQTARLVRPAKAGAAPPTGRFSQPCQRNAPRRKITPPARRRAGGAYHININHPDTRA